MRSNMGAGNRNANVVAFPMGVQAAERLRARRYATAVAAVPAKPVIYDGAWYHEEAVAEEQASTQGRKADH
ncbi:DUF2735 domain-containing protein [Aureimonas leprariae]|uniref:DUF2735 domain-containing protein n=1 Tax=Plantimonas leprariae TaxID=2615207 RepID=A0A7V7PKW0_9HYPH|nr:DUF2735 domain-containing protein [Aureimonas leprariae]KAB0676683.1 DUF2735 domain-containing protein [Aureimonas leprariae]